MESMLQNFFTGNHAAAIRSAKRFTFQKIYHALWAYGYNHRSASLTARYLKGQITFQDICDAD